MLNAYRQLYFDLLQAKGLAETCLHRVIDGMSEALAVLVSRHALNREWRPHDTNISDQRPLGWHSRGLTHLVRQATAEDLPGIVAIHQKAFSNFFLIDWATSSYAVTMPWCFTTVQESSW